MISFLKGTLQHLEPGFAVVEVQGIGYHVQISLQTYSKIKDTREVFLHTYLNVREDALVLFGFSAETERKLFQQLISVNGVGPGTAIVMLSSLSSDELRSAIIHEDVATLQSIKGIGMKTAQRVIIELKDKVRKDHADTSTTNLLQGHNTVRQEALSALVTLGIAKSAAEKSVDAILKKSGITITLEDLVKQALKNN